MLISVSLVAFCCFVVLSLVVVFSLVVELSKARPLMRREHPCISRRRAGLSCQIVGTTMKSRV